MRKLFETTKRVTTIDAPQIILTKAPFIQSKQISLAKSFRQDVETILLPLKVLRMRIQKTPYQKTYKMQTTL